MSNDSTMQVNLQTMVKSRSIGLKLLIVCGLALVMAIPARFVSSLVEERATRTAEVTREISGHVGGRQTFLGPTLAIPYSIAPRSPGEPAEQGVYRVFAAQASASVKTKTEERRRSLFKVPVFRADLNLEATFDLTGVPSAAPQGAALDWSRAEIQVGVTDARGALSDATMIIGGKTWTLVPSQISDEV